MFLHFVLPQIWSLLTNPIFDGFLAILHGTNIARKRCNINFRTEVHFLNQRGRSIYKWSLNEKYPFVSVEHHLYVNEYKKKRIIKK
jgi:hypothetical protein